MSEPTTDLDAYEAQIREVLAHAEAFVADYRRILDEIAERRALIAENVKARALAEEMLRQRDAARLALAMGHATEMEG